MRAIHGKDRRKDGKGECSPYYNFGLNTSCYHYKDLTNEKYIYNETISTLDEKGFESNVTYKSCAEAD